MSDTPTTAIPPIEGRYGGTSAQDAYGTQVSFPQASAQQLTAGFVVPITDAAVLSVTGADAIKFLHGQLTNDVEHLDVDDARRFGYCTAKGRLFSSLLGWRHDGGLSLMVSGTLADATRKRLSMFVLRAKVQITADAKVLFGVGGAAAPSALEALGLTAPASMKLARAGDRCVIGLPAIATDGVQSTRWLVCVPEAQASEVWSALASTLTPASTSIWRWSELRAGIPMIVEATREHFVPQSVNLELVGGLSFTKGCYPGQEVVARSQYLGKLKRRSFLAHVDAVEPAPGSDINDGQGGEPCGEVIMAAPSPAGGVDLLFESRIDAIAQGALRVADQPLSMLALPYDIPAKD